MKKKTEKSRLALDKETIAKLNEEQLSPDQTQEVEGGVTAFTATGSSCCGVSGNGTYTSCGK